MRRAFRWCRRRWGRSLAVLVVCGLVGVNALAYQHAQAMTHFEVGPPSAGASRRPASLLGKLRLALCGVRLSRPQHPERPEDLGLPAEEVTIAGKAGRLAAWYVSAADAEKAGPRGLVILFHGYITCKARLLAEAAAFRALGQDCLLVDFRGSGESEGDTTTIGYHEADDVASAVEYARGRWPGRRLTLYGVSMGAVAVLRAVGELGVAADRLILECPFDRMSTAVRVRCVAMGVPAFPAAELLLFWGGAMHGFNAFGHNPVRYAEGVRAPALLMVGDADARVSVAHVQEIYDRLGGEKRLFVFPGLGHESYVRRDAARWRRSF